MHRPDESWRLPSFRSLQFFAASHDQLSVNYGGRQIQAPHVCRIRLQSTGKHAISNEQFNGGAPLIIQLGVDIVETLSRDQVPPYIAEADLRCSGIEIKLYPSILVAGETVNMSVLTEGAPVPTISHSLVDTKVEFAVSQIEAEQLREQQLNAARKWTRAMLAVASVMLLIGVIGAIAASTSGRSLVDQVSLSASPADFSYYYPSGGVVPTESPTYSNSGGDVDHCWTWSSWASERWSCSADN